MKELDEDYEKKYTIQETALKELVKGDKTCIVSDSITVGGAKVGHMYREEPYFEEDSGWRFFAGDESPDYVDNEKNLDIFELNVIANHDTAIVKYLEKKQGAELERIADSDDFKPVE